jgi:O-antigen/teichoic acid export membrane protein
MLKKIRAISHLIRKSHESRNAFANMAGKGFNLIFSVIFLPVYISTLGHEAYGLVAFQLTIQVIFSILELGLPATVTREIALHINSAMGKTEYLNSVIRTSEAIAAGVGMLVFSIIVLFSSMIATKWLVVQSIPHTVVIQSLWIMGCQVGLQFLSLVYNGSLVGAGKQVLQNTILSTGALLRGLAAVGIILIFPDVRVFLLSQLVSTVIMVVILRMAAYQVLPAKEGKLSVDVINKMFPFASQIILNSLVLTVAAQLDRIIMSKTLPISFLGYYSIAAYLSSGIMIAGVSMLTAMYPGLVHHAGFSDLETAGKHYFTRTNRLACTLMPLTIFIILFGTDVMHSWLHDPKIAEATRVVLPCLALSAYFSAINQIPISLASAKGFMYPAIIGQLILTSLMTVPTFMLIRELGMNGAAFANLASSCLYLICITPIIHRYMNIGNKFQWIREVLFNRSLLYTLPLIVSYFLGLVIPTISSTIKIVMGALGLSVTLYFTVMHLTNTNRQIEIFSKQKIGETHA